MNNLTTAISNSREIYRQALENCEKNVQVWKKHEQEYIELKERLDQFSKKLTHDVMVPFGKFALMPGHLRHTNEVMVLLGDNWFVERSAFQAIEIIDRRLKYIAETLGKYEEEKQSYVERLSAMATLLDVNPGGDYFEIREPITTDKEAPKKVRIAHKPDLCLEGPVKISSKKKVSDDEFSVLMGRLDELDLQERRENGQSEETESAGKSPFASHVDEKNTKSSRKVAWKDDDASTPVFPEIGPLTSQAPAVTDAEPKPTKSILKNREEHTPVGELPPSPYEERPRVISSVTEQAFSGKVLERATFDLSSEAMEHEPRAKQPVRRISRFAQERAGAKKQ